MDEDMKKMSTINILIFLINLFLLASVFAVAFMDNRGMDAIMSFGVLIPLYIFMTFFTFYQLGDKWLIAFNAGNCIGIFIYTALVMATASSGGNFTLAAIAITDVLFLTGFNAFFIIFDICKFIYSKIKRNDRVEAHTIQQQAQPQQVQPNVDTTSQVSAAVEQNQAMAQGPQSNAPQQVMRPVQTNVEVNAQCADNQKEVVDLQNNNIEVNNVTINLNNLTPEQKDQLLVILAQNNNNN